MSFRDKPEVHKEVQKGNEERCHDFRFSVTVIAAQRAITACAVHGC